MGSSGWGGVSARSSSTSWLLMLVMRSSGSLRSCSRQLLRSSASSVVRGGGRGGVKEVEGEGEDMVEGVRSKEMHKSRQGQN